MESTFFTFSLNIVPATEISPSKNATMVVVPEPAVGPLPTNNGISLLAVVATPTFLVV